MQEVTTTREIRHPHSHSRRLGVLALGALGIVYGDIGTSPLYALRECFHGPHGMEPTRDNVIGVLSLVFWVLIVVISIKYLLYVMRADNRGEGGILALMALARSNSGDGEKKKRHWVLVALGLFGAALLYGDGVITPAITTLSAVEGLEVATSFFKPYLVPATIAILIGLFLLQRRGTAGIGAIFGPVMILWFLALAALGIRGIAVDASVFEAINPLHAIQFFVRNGWLGFLVLGAVFLVVTGGEALYADMGHFGRKPIQLAWFFMVLPALLLNYFGQGAYLIHHPEAASNPFFRMAPSWALYPLVVLAAAAAVIASQAVISGAFSLTRQAVQLGYCPRVEIIHTSSEEIGQIYIPGINWALMLATIGLVLGFRTSTGLAAAYGIAVTSTMVITTLLAYVVARKRWGTGALVAGSVTAFFLVIDVAFFGANIIKVAQGGWFPLLMAAVIYCLMATWKRGRQILGERMRQSSVPVELFIADVVKRAPTRVKGTAVFLSSDLSGGTPIALLHNVKHNRILHEKNVFLSIKTEEVPYVPREDRLQWENLGEGFFRVVGRYGFQEDPNVPRILRRAAEQGLDIDAAAATYFLSRNTLIPSKKPGMAIWREKMFAFMTRNALRPTQFFRIPPNRVVELGMQVEI
jgi:KUP system potassium uptake protein